MSSNNFLENKKKVEMIQILVDHKFDSDPVKKWKREVERSRVSTTDDLQTSYTTYSFIVTYISL